MGRTAHRRLLGLGFAMTPIAFSVQALFNAIRALQEHRLSYWAVPHTSK
ncbi:hypothetical protein [Streptomyces galbus]|nr:hypothetical protein [Streptomyces galbus]